MPYPSQVTAEQILQVTAQLIEDQGVEHVALSDVAKALGVQTPSLYRYVSGRTDLLSRVNLRFLNGLFAALSGCADPSAAAEEQMLAVMTAYRIYAHEHPRQYLMSFAYMHVELRPDEDVLLQLVLPLQSLMAEIAGPQRSLAALRSTLAYVHGFVMLELTNQLRRGGDLVADFHMGAQATLTGWRAGG